MLSIKSKLFSLPTKSYYWLLIGLVKSFFLTSLFLWPLSVWAVPAITNVSLSGQSSATLNPQAGESLKINLTASEPVKFSTIAICAIEVSDCTRSTAVKYFTQTADYNLTVEKFWDGKRGGANPDYVPMGTYRLVVTLVGQGGDSDKAEVDLSSNLITVSLTGSTVPVDSATSTSDGGDGGTATSTKVNSSGGGNYYSASDFAAYSSYGPISSYIDVPKLAVSVGRARSVLVGVPIEFRGSADNYPSQITYHFSFGDGTEAIGDRVSHSYSFPGMYEVVLTASSHGEEVVARTKVKVAMPQLSIKEFLPFSHLVTIHNSGNEEVNIGEFRLVGISGYQGLAKDTLIQPQADLSLYLVDGLVGSSNISLGTSQGFKMASSKRGGGQLIVAQNSPSSTLMSVTETGLVEEEAKLAIEWEKQYTDKTDSKKLMIIEDSEKTQAEVASKTLKSATDTNLLPVAKKVVSPTLSLTASTYSSESSRIYQINSPRPFFSRMVKWVDGIFNP